MSASPNTDITHLLRPEALQGKAYARLSHPLAMASPSLRRSLGAAGGVVLAMVLGLALTPVKNSLHGAGVIEAPDGARVVRVANAGQVLKVAQEGQVVQADSVVAVVGQSAQSESGIDPAQGSAQKITALMRAREREFRLLEEKHGLSVMTATQGESAARERLVALEALVRNQQELVAQSDALHRKISGVAGHVTRIDALALAERNTGAKNRLLDLESEARKVRQEVSERQRARRILDIEHARELERLRRQYDMEETDAVEKAIARHAAVPAGVGGRVATVYKRPGDWVAAGDEVALVIGERAPRDETVRISIPVRTTAANELAVGQQARVWPKGSRSDESALAGKVERIEQRTTEAYRLKDQQPASVPGSFVAHIVVPHASQSQGLLHALRPGAEVEVEIVFESRPLYRALLPQGGGKQ